MAESKSNILNKKNGFNVMVNMYIIRYMYSHLDKATAFKHKEAKRKKSISFNKEVMRISGPRMNNILHGVNFEMSANEVERFNSMFNISKEHFLKNGIVIEVYSLTVDDWKCYFNEFYYTDFEINIPKQAKKERIKKVEKKLKELVSKDTINHEYETDTAVYRIYYYFKNGVAYQEETRLTKFCKSLSQLKVSDWEEMEEDMELLEKYQGILSQHLHYINVTIDYKRLKTNSK